MTTIATTFPLEVSTRSQRKSCSRSKTSSLCADKDRLMSSAGQFKERRFPHCIGARMTALMSILHVPTLASSFLFNYQGTIFVVWCTHLILFGGLWWTNQDTVGDDFFQLQSCQRAIGRSVGCLCASAVIFPSSESGPLHCVNVGDKISSGLVSGGVCLLEQWSPKPAL